MRHFFQELNIRELFAEPIDWIEDVPWQSK